MTKRHLSYDAERAPRVREMFSRLAARYDLVNDLMSFGMHRRWKRETVRLAVAGPRPPGVRVLDLCCGSGDLAFAAEASGASVTGADFTLPMLADAPRRQRAGGHRSVFLCADVLALPFRDGSFDAVTVGYGLRNVADLPRLSEIRRVLAPGGRAAILDFGKPDNPFAAALYAGYLRTAMPLMGWLFHGDPETYRYIPDSLVRYPGQRGVAQLMRDAGFADPRYENRLLGTMGINLGEAPLSR